MKLKKMKITNKIQIKMKFQIMVIILFNKKINAIKIIVIKKKKKKRKMLNNKILMTI